MKVIVRVKANKGLLLGGVKFHESSLMTYEEAVAWADAVIETNKKAGRDPIYDGMRLVDDS